MINDVNSSGQERLEDTLARRLGIDRGSFLEIYGSGWKELDPEIGSLSFEWDHEKHGIETWYMSGQPPQLMLQIAGPTVTVARPAGHWQGAWPLVYEPAGKKKLSGNAEADKRAIASVLKNRRATFRYCAYCRSLKPPEWMEESTCMSCASEWLGMVY
jgi:hypothetical protein